MHGDKNNRQCTTIFSSHESPEEKIEVAGTQPFATTTK